MELTVVHSILRVDQSDPNLFEWQTDVLLQDRPLIRYSLPIPAGSAYALVVEFVKKSCSHYEERERGQVLGSTVISGVTSDAR